MKLTPFAFGHDVARADNGPAMKPGRPEEWLACAIHSLECGRISVVTLEACKVVDLCDGWHTNFDLQA